MRLSFGYFIVLTGFRLNREISCESQGTPMTTSFRSVLYIESHRYYMGPKVELMRPVE